MQTSIVKWGNSHGIRLPEAFLQSIKIKENDLVDVTFENGRIIIKKVNQKEHKTTKQRLIDFYGEDFKKHAKTQKETDWGQPVGNEVW
jgi:antitoxin MazE